MKKVLLFLATASLLAACGEQTDKPLDAYATPYVPPVARVSGRVANGLNSAPIVGAAVSIGAVAGVTNATGRFLLSNVPVSGRTLVHVAASGYVDGFPITSTIKDGTSSVATQLLPINTVSPVDAATGGTAYVAASPANLTITGNSLVLADATPASGSINVAVTPINPAQNLISMPGDFTSSANEPIESFGAIAVGGANSGGAAVDLATGQTATVRIPLATRNTDTPPASLSLFYFNASTGYWVEQGTATLGGFAPNQYYQGTISRFGIWTAAKTVSPRVFLNGCVVHEGTVNPVVNVRVQAEGINYSGISAAITGVDGKFRMPIRANSTVIVNGQLGSFVTNTFSQSVTTQQEVTMANCLSLAALSGAPRITLTWGASPSDIDSHIFAPDGTHIFYSAKGTLATDPFVSLDVDDTTSYGPEVVTITRLMVGTYTYGVRNFSGSHNPGITDSPARVELRQGDELTVFTPTVAMGETSTNNWWTIFSLTVDAQCNVTVTPLNVFSTGPDAGPVAPTIPSAVARQYCSSP